MDMSETDQLEGKAPLDRLGRPLTNLRLSVTDRCNLRCSYCMPEEKYTWLPRADILSFEESADLIDAFCDVGVRRVRLTGGEPLLRSGLTTLVRLLAAKPAIEDLAMTTNAILLDEMAIPLKQAGMGRLTVSLDTLRADRFRELTRCDELDRVVSGIDAAQSAGFVGTKLNVVVMKGFNDDEIFDLLDFGRERGIEVRFIEYMDVGGATRWRPESVVSKRELMERLEVKYGDVRAVSQTNQAAPAERYQLGDGTRFGIIASQTAPFCRTCDRSRLTADGMWYLCLYARIGLDLREVLRAGTPRGVIAQRIRRAWGARADRAAEERSLLGNRTGLAAEELRSDPHLEMHTRGG